LKQILVNLVGNAIKFTEVGGVRLVLRLLQREAQPSQMQFDVVDSGIGMTSQQTARIFRPFTQADSSTSRKFGGTGLGLTISKRLAQMLGGDIVVRTALGEGSTFSLTVETGPLDGVKMVDRPDEPMKKPEQPQKVHAESEVKLSCRVLLAEDGPDNQRLISFLLKKAGADVTVAENGQVAVDLVATANHEGRPFDIVLMDVQMPVMDGCEATQRLRESGYRQPIVALTAHAMKHDHQRCLDAGCDAVLTKPIDRGTLVRAVAAHTTQRPADCPH
jgi:CheY-like chemotaxis protein